MAAGIAPSNSVCVGYARVLLALFLAILFQIFCVSTPAQTPSGIAQGTISDQNGALVANVRVALRRRDASPANERETVSDGQGGFLFENVPNGEYTLIAERESFLVLEQAITISSRTESFDLTLHLAPVSESVTVRNAEDSIETTLRLPGASLRETPRSVTVINSERAREQNFRQVPDVLAYIPNMAVNSYRTGGYHFYSRGYRMLPDDTRVDGFAGINTGGGFGASLFGVEEVVLLRGPASLLDGLARWTRQSRYEASAGESFDDD